MKSHYVNTKWASLYSDIYVESESGEKSMIHKQEDKKIFGISIEPTQKIQVIIYGLLITSSILES